MGKILTVRVVPDLFLSSLQTRPKAQNGRAATSGALPPSYEKSMRLRPGAASWGCAVKRKSREKAAASKQSEPKFSPKRLKSQAKHLRIQASEILQQPAKKSLRISPSFEFLPVSMPGTPPPEYIGARSRAPSLTPVREAGPAPQAAAEAAQASASVGANVPRARQDFAHHEWTPASITMLMLWGVMCAVVASPVYDAVKALTIFGVIVGTCVRHMYLECHYVEGQPYPWL